MLSMTPLSSSKNSIQKNREWLVRPQVALSEFAQAVIQNLPQVIAAEQTVFITAFIQQLTLQTDNILLHLNNLNTSDNTTKPTPLDIQHCLTEDVNFYQLLCQAMNSVRALFNNEHSYADKLVDDRPSALPFKNSHNSTIDVDPTDVLSPDIYPTIQRSPKSSTS